jgi:hypothetical protein
VLGSTFGDPLCHAPMPTERLCLFSIFRITEVVGNFDPAARSSGVDPLQLGPDTLVIC